MERFLSLAIVAVVAFPAEARIHTFQDVLVKASHVAALKTLYVDVSRNPAVIDVEKLSCELLDETEIKPTASVVLAPASVNVSQFIECGPSLHLTNRELHNVFISRATGCGVRLTQKMALGHSGTYILYAAHCGKPGSLATLNIKVSGDQIDAHERGWSFIFFIFLMFHVFLLAAFVAYWRNCGESASGEVYKDILNAIVMAVLSHGLGFVSYFLLQPIPLVECVHTTLWAGTISSTMVAMISVSGMGCSEPNPQWRFGYWLLFFMVLLAGLVNHGILFEKYGYHPRNAKYLSELGSITWGIAGSFFIFGFICVRLLARSFSSFQQRGLLECIAVFRKVAVGIVVYAGLGVASAASMAYDVPGGELGFHRVVGVASIQVIQMIGLVGTMLTLSRTKFDTNYAPPVEKDVEKDKHDDELSIVHHTTSQEMEPDKRVQESFG